MNYGCDNNKNKYKNYFSVQVHLSWGFFLGGGGHSKSGHFYSHNYYSVLLYQPTLILSGDDAFQKNCHGHSLTAGELFRVKCVELSHIQSTALAQTLLRPDVSLNLLLKL
jgi:hypothetical protein